MPMMNKRIALFLALALLLGFSAGYSEGAGAYAAGQLPAGEKTFAEDDIVAGIESGAGKVYRSVGRFPGTDRYALGTKDPSDDGPVSMWEYAGAEGDPIYMMDVMGVAFPADFMVERAKSIYTDRNEAGERVVNGTTLSGITRSGLD